MKASQKQGKSGKQHSKQKQTMIATAASTNTTPVWIDGEDGGTVISEITHDAFANGDSLTELLGSWREGTAAMVTPSKPKLDDGSHTEKPQSLGSSTTTKPAGTKKSKSSSKSRQVTMTELAEHNTDDDCWVAIHGVVYDLTEFADEHPAGPESIRELAGQDGTEAFAAVHNKNILEDFDEDRIGVLVSS